MNFAIYSRQLKERDIPYVQELLEALYESGGGVYIYGPYFEQLNRANIYFGGAVTLFERHEDIMEYAIDFMITLGGDGTILDTPLLIRDSNIPIIGINLGRLGFLASIEQDHVRFAVESLLQGTYTLERRTLLFLEANKPLFGIDSFGLNDFTILKRDTSSMIIVHTYINGEFLNSYWADGIILSTPTGSTGYSLSCGGPIVFPNSGNFVLTPVAPHNLNVRPIVIADDSVVSFKVEGRASSFLCTLDARVARVDQSYELAVRKADFMLNLIRLPNRSFLSTIRDKLAWGLDSRNYT